VHKREANTKEDRGIVEILGFKSLYLGQKKVFERRNQNLVEGM